MGTAFLRTRQSAATEAHREAIARAADTDTVLTRAMSGRLARGIPNRAMHAIEASGLIAPFPAQNWLTGVFRAEAARRGDGDLLSLWAGQSAALATRDGRARGLPRAAGGPAALTRSGGRRRTSNPRSPVGAASVTVADSTRSRWALRHPREHLVDLLVGVPSTSASTVPSRRLRTQPVTPTSRGDHARV